MTKALQLSVRRPACLIFNGVAVDLGMGTFMATIGVNNTLIYYPSTGCTGTPYSLNDFSLSTGKTLAPIPQLVGSKLYVPDDSLGGFQTVTFASYSADGVTCITTSPGITSGTPMKLLFDLETHFTPPLNMH